MGELVKQFLAGGPGLRSLTATELDFVTEVKIVFNRPDQARLFYWTLRREFSDCLKGQPLNPADLGVLYDLTYRDLQFGDLGPKTQQFDAETLARELLSWSYLTACDSPAGKAMRQAIVSLDARAHSSRRSLFTAMAVHAGILKKPTTETVDGT